MAERPARPTKNPKVTSGVSEPPARKKEGPVAAQAPTRAGEASPASSQKISTKPAPPASRPEPSAPKAAATPVRTAGAQPAPPAVRPSAPAVEARPAGSDPDEFDRALDAVFGGAAPGVRKATSGKSEQDETASRDLFVSIAANHARPLKSFISELRRGAATKEWIEICRPVMRSMAEAAESLELAAAAKRMKDFDEALSLAEGSPDPVLGGDVRGLILSAYEDLVQALPHAFAPGEEPERRESTIIHSLLKQIPDVGHVTFEKLYSAGLTSLDTLFLAGREDLAQTTGISPVLCERICGKFQEYRKELEGIERGTRQSSCRARLAELVAELRRRHEGFEDACARDWASPEHASRKRESRRNRLACALQINVVLAEMGELDLVEQMEKLSFERRIGKLEEYMNSIGILPPTRPAAPSLPGGAAAKR